MNFSFLKHIYPHPCSTPQFFSSNHDLPKEKTLPSTSLWSRIENYMRDKLVSSFFVGYKALPQDVILENRKELFSTYQAKQIFCLNAQNQPIDVVLLPSQSPLKTGNILVTSINAYYQQANLKRWNIFLDNGASVVLWNPTRLGQKNYSSDFLCVLRALRRDYPDQTIAVSSYCMATDPTILAVSKMDDSKIHLIIDRGHGNAPEFVASLNFLFRFKAFRQIVIDECDCRGIHKIKEIQGSVFFIFAGRIDQLMDRRERLCCSKLSMIRPGLSKDLLDARGDSDFAIIQGGDHWSKWDYKVYDKVLSFLSEVQIVTSQKKFEVDPLIFPLQPNLSCFQENMLPLKLKCKALVFQLN